MSKKYNVCLSTHQGKVRADNEDNFAINTVVRNIEDKEKNLRGSNAEEPLVCSVFDGMGGESSGEIASKIAADNAKVIYENIKNSVGNIEENLSDFVTKTNNTIVNVIGNDSKSRGGTTFVTAIFDRGFVFTYSLGDSRMYVYKNGVLTQITNDHTLAMKKYRANIYTLEEAKNSNDSHKLTAFLGVDLGEQEIVAESYPVFELNKGDRILLCSDGLYDMCTDDEISEIMSKNSKTTSLKLVNRALENGGSDNITCMVIDCTEE